MKGQDQQEAGTAEEPQERPHWARIQHECAADVDVADLLSAPPRSRLQFGERATSARDRSPNAQLPAGVAALVPGPAGRDLGLRRRRGLLRVRALSRVWGP